MMIAISFSRAGIERAEPHEGADALDEIAELRASQQRVEGPAEAGAARARLDRLRHALLLRRSWSPVVSVVNRPSLIGRSSSLNESA